MQLERIQAPVQPQLQKVNQLILESIQSEAKIINELGKYVFNNGGKRLRPLLTLLAAQAADYRGEQHLALAATIELIHTATLLHDDVVDNASTRRGHKTANALWGGSAAVLVGDYLYSKAFQSAVGVNNTTVLNILIQATNTIVEGEALQLVIRDNLAVSEADYLNVVRYKTAKLFEASAQIGAVIAQADPSTEQAFLRYGHHLGTAFQLVDDLLDFSGEETGKDLGNDLVEGKITLPLIYALQHAKAEDNALLQEAIRNKDLSNFSVIQEILQTCGAMDYVKKCAKIEVDKAKSSLNKVPASVYRTAAEELADFAICRTH